MKTNYCKKSGCGLSQRHAHGIEEKGKEVIVHFQRRIKEVFIDGRACIMSL